MTESSSAASSELIRLKSEHTALQQQVSALRDALLECQDIVRHFAQRHPKFYAEGNEQDPLGAHKLLPRITSLLADAGLTEPPESGIKVPLAKMSSQLRNVLYDLIRKVPPLADHGDQQAMTEFIAEVKP